MKTSILITAIFFLLGCSKHSTSENVDVIIRILVEDKEARSLLDPTHKNYIDVSKVRVYYLINGQKKYQYEPNWSCPSHFCAISDDGKRYVKLSPNISITEDFPITYIEWSEYETDEIKCHFNRTENSVVCDKVWFNQELVYPNDTKDRIFKIIK